MITVGYVNVFVTDLADAIEFYRTKLGLKAIRMDTEHGYASFDAGPVSLGLAAVEGEQASLAGRHTGIGLVVADLEAEHARLVGSGVEFAMPPTRQPWGGFMALVRDPAGNLLYLDEASAAH
jgi:predicted enzyme related to lactoylglutathione lyase